MTALLGPTPSEFLHRSKETSKYWERDGESYKEQSLISPLPIYPDKSLGKWKGPVPVPIKTLQSLVKSLEGDDRDNFLDFIQCLLCWLPEERPGSPPGRLITIPGYERVFHLLRELIWRYSKFPLLEKGLIMWKTIICQHDVSPCLRTFGQIAQCSSLPVISTTYHGWGWRQLRC